MIPMNGKVAVVTGGSRGLGKCITRELLTAQATVVFVDVNEKLGEITQQELSALGSVEFRTCDITDEEQVKVLFEETVAKYGHVDYLVNNAAATLTKFVKIHECEYKTAKLMADVNFCGTFLCMKYAIRQMLKQESRGNIVCVSSASAHYASDGLTLYAASTRAVNALVQGAAHEYAPEGIRINAILPGSMETEAMKQFRLEDPASYQAAMDSTPIRYIAEPQEVARAIRWLLSDEAAYAVGSEFVFDGGVSL